MQQVAEVRRYWDSRLYWDTALFRISHRPATYCKKKKKNIFIAKNAIGGRSRPYKNVTGNILMFRFWWIVIYFFASSK